MKRLAMLSVIFAVPFIAEAKSILEPGETLTAGRVLQSPNGCFTLGFRDQGNLVLVNKSGTVIWSSGTFNSNATQLYINYGGDLKLLNSAGNPINWDTKTSGAYGFLRLQNDGNLVIYNDSFVPLWHIGTYNASCG
ncbi:hypothetical protein [Silvanigrella aquatica]|uniref:Bulb-type lectin domain-containing protein n=1 Tax=Silvanigrella aquatica TaxID=1915309 RepID=A0A1L4D0E7_9BACT|nr:hypothetical protein [Silvanigrella aquatica]APJ03675.1 hypothetical protein AXG55_07055 [Silvanigrella aquatica]